MIETPHQVAPRTATVQQQARLKALDAEVARCKAQAKEAQETGKREWQRRNYRDAVNAYRYACRHFNEANDTMLAGIALRARILARD